MVEWLYPTARLYPSCKQSAHMQSALCCHIVPEAHVAACKRTHTALCKPSTRVGCFWEEGGLHFSFTCISPEHVQMSDGVAVRSQTAKIKLIKSTTAVLQGILHRSSRHKNATFGLQSTKTLGQQGRHVLHPELPWIENCC